MWVSTGAIIKKVGEMLQYRGSGDCEKQLGVRHKMNQIGTNKERDERAKEWRST